MSHPIYDTDYVDFYDPRKCLGDLGEKWCSFKWRIYNFQLNPLETFKSPVFTTRLLPKTHWFMEVKLSSPGDLKHIEISLRRLQSKENTVSVVDVIYKVICDEDIRTSDKRTYVYNNEEVESVKYCYSAPFQKSKTSYVTFEGKLRPNKVMIKDVDHGKYDATLPVDLRKLLQSSEVYDTIIQVDDKEFFAHYAILCARIPKLLPPGNSTVGNRHIVKIYDLPAFLVKEMLKYAYTGQAYVDLESVSSYRHILIQHNNFFQKCCWDDNPTATSFFNYETDSLLWKLKGYCKESNLGQRRMKLLKVCPSEMEFSLDILESQEEKKCLTLKFKFCSEEIRKPTVFSCTYSLIDDFTKEIFELGETETLLQSNITAGEVKLCSLLEIKRGQSSLNLTENELVLKTDFKFCYGSSKSSIENLYVGQFDISQCTNCALLSADMYRLFHHVEFKDIMLKVLDGDIVSAHKAILIARWEDAEKYKLKKDTVIKINHHSCYTLNKLLDQLYTGIASN